MSTLFTSNTVLLANYSSDNIKTNSIQTVSACLPFFAMIWNFFTSGLALFVHLNLTTLLCRPFTLQTNLLCLCIPVYLTDAVWLVRHHGLVWLVIIHTAKDHV